MEVWNLLSKCSEHILLNIDVNTHGARKPLSIRHGCGLRASSSNSHHTLVSGILPSHASTKNIKNMEVGSIFQILQTNTVENTHRYEALRPVCARSTPLTWTRSSMPTTGCRGSGKSKSPRRCIRVESPGKDHDRHKAIGTAILATTCGFHKGLGWSQFHSLLHHQALDLVAEPVA